MTFSLTAVYNANGGLLGEAAYIVGHILGTTSCSLCDITHSPLRRKPEWDAMVATLPYEIVLKHRNEVSDHLEAHLVAEDLPFVVHETSEGYDVVLSAEALAECDGSPAEFLEKLQASLRDKGLT
jgi:hypothetical protein